MAYDQKVKAKVASLSLRASAKKFGPLLSTFVRACEDRLRSDTVLSYLRYRQSIRIVLLITVSSYKDGNTKQKGN